MTTISSTPAPVAGRLRAGYFCLVIAASGAGCGDCAPPKIPQGRVFGAVYFPATGSPAATETICPNVTLTFTRPGLQDPAVGLSVNLPASSTWVQAASKCDYDFNWPADRAGDAGGSSNPWTIVATYQGDWGTQETLSTDTAVGVSITENSGTRQDFHLKLPVPDFVLGPITKKLNVPPTPSTVGVSVSNSGDAVTADIPIKVVMWPCDSAVTQTVVCDQRGVEDGVQLRKRCEATSSGMVPGGLKQGETKIATVTLAKGTYKPEGTGSSCDLGFATAVDVYVNAAGGTTPQVQGELNTSNNDRMNAAVLFLVE